MPNCSPDSFQMLSPRSMDQNMKAMCSLVIKKRDMPYSGSFRYLVSYSNMISGVSSSKRRNGLSSSTAVLLQLTSIPLQTERAVACSTNLN